VTPQQFKDISNNAGAFLEFSCCPGGCGYPLLRGVVSHCLVAAALGLRESNISVADSGLKVNSELEMLGKGAGPGKHHGVQINSMHGTNGGTSVLFWWLGHPGERLCWYD
jgi:hypothetical protein